MLGLAGKVKWWNPEKGYGFITPEDSGPDVFVHCSAVKKAGVNELVIGERILFDLSQRGVMR